MLETADPRGLQTSLWGGTPVETERGVPQLSGSKRHVLESGAWVDHWDAWLPDADSRFFELREAVDWRSEHRQMYDRTVAVPRLVAWFSTAERFPLDWVAAAMKQLNIHYQSQSRIGDRDVLVSAGMCLYRDGRDSVAWHGDRLGRARTNDTLIAIVSLGAPRSLRLRPLAGGPVSSFEIGHGDLLVMGGSCQRTYEHCVPKTAKPVGPRISIQFRPAGVG